MADNPAPDAELRDGSPPREGGSRRIDSKIFSRSARATAGRISWGLADQTVSSLTNFAVGIFVARSLGVAAFGVFTIAWVTYGLLLNVSRGLSTDPLVVRFSGGPTATWRAAAARSSGSALLVGVAAGGVSVVVGSGVGGSIGAGLVALGFVLPGVLLQDSWRFAFFAAGQGRKAFINDVVWAMTLMPALALATQHESVVGFILAWGLSGAVAAGCGCVQLRLLPWLSGIRGWLRQQSDLGSRYVVENVSNSGAAQLRMYGLGAIAGLVDVGALRGAELLLGPFLAVLMGFGLAAVPEAARVVRGSPRRLMRFCLFIGGGQAVAALTWGLALLVLLPEKIGRFLLGSVWEPAAALILPVTLSVAGAGFVAGATVGLRGLGAARRSLRARLFGSALYLVGGLAGAAVAGAFGTSWGSALAMWCGAAVWWAQLRYGIREAATEALAETPTAVDTHVNHGEARSP